ncbi:hypothetical protein [Kitasatospora sp. NPDC056531]|uniref:hypothetical protein n=1 Tax=Kitasatospora sp. NPDC056531 TaxID=3345856 RepID=UPI0036AB7176
MSLLASLTATASSSASVWEILGCVGGAGGLGGLVNALLSDNKLAIPWMKRGILQPGFLGNVLLGAFGAVVSWGLYGPLKDTVILGAHPPTEAPAALTVTALVGAALTGVGGARLVTSEVDKLFLRKAGMNAAIVPTDPGLANTLRTASPSEAAATAEDKARIALNQPSPGAGD